MAAEVGSSSTRVQAMKWEGGRAVWALEDLAAEEPLEIRVRGRAITVTMRTPGAADADGVSSEDAELAAGFLLTEGVIRSRADIEAIEHCGRNEMGNVLNVRLAPLVHVDFERLTRHVFAASSCGLCGKASIEQVRGCHPPVRSEVRVAAGDLLAMAARMRESQSMFDRTGGLHAAAIFDANRVLIAVREDIGRHNATDKVIGRAMLDGVGLADAVLVVSGRTSFEIVQKAAAAKVPIVAGVSAPSSLAVEFAKEMGQTLIGFLRPEPGTSGGRMNIYANQQRVIE
jgi:FdhD protein